jgi:hypothetical protein
VDGDGDLDILALSEGAGLLLWRAQGTAGYDDVEALHEAVRAPGAVLPGPHARLLTIDGGELVAFDPLSPDTPGQALGAVGEYVRDLEVGDFDGDGIADVAVCDELGVLVAYRGG